MEHKDYIKTQGPILAEKLLEWYHANKRDLPWRKTHDAYSIWISEVMLQQTQVDTVIHYYINFMRKFPNIKDLAEAKEDDLLKAWEGLGYYSRAKRLKQAAQVIIEKYDGQFPRSYKEALELPGIGPYTAGAVLSIAYNFKFPAVDGNVLRVFARLFNDHRDISDTKTRQSFEEMGKALLPEDCRHFNQSLMELGAQICVPKNPKCETCPVASLCLSLKANCQKDLPIKIRRTKNHPLHMEAGWVMYDDYVLVVKRPSEGLLASLWGLPIVQRQEGFKEGRSIKEELEKILGSAVKLINPLKKAKHIFSHRTWHMTLYGFKIEKMSPTNNSKISWIKLDEIDNYALPTAFKKLLP